MKRHLLPRAACHGWVGEALTIDPCGGEEMPVGIARSMAVAFGRSTTLPTYDEVRGRVLRIQWLGLTVEFAIGRVTR
jgi:hypothetical protein